MEFKPSGARLKSLELPISTTFAPVSTFYSSIVFKLIAAYIINSKKYYIIILYINLLQ